MKNKIILTIVLFIAIMTSCSDETLEVKNENSYDAETFFTTPQSYNEAATAAYAAFYFNGLFAREFYFIFDLLGNDAEKNFPLQGGLLEFPNYTYTPNNGELSNFWSSLYKMIFRTNLVIDLMDNWETDVPEEVALRTRLKGEMLFLKSLCNFWLVTLYGDVPLKATLEDHNNFQQERTPASEIWAAIELDLIDAAENLPVSYSEQSDLGRATKGAAIALLGKTYLYQEKYAEAVTELSKLITSPYSYRLTSSLDDLFVFDDVANAENVFSVMHGEWQGWGVSNAYYMFGGQETWGNRSTFTGRAMEYGFNDWWNVLLSDALVDAFTYEDESGAAYMDPRSSLTYYADESIGGDNTFCDFCDGGPISYTGLIQEGQVSWRKYEYYETTERYNQPSSYINAQVIRYADVLLMLAEANIKNGNVDAALPLINQVRARSGAFEYTTLGNADNAFKLLKRERQIELAGEQHRFFDLVRWGELVSTVNAEKKAAIGTSPVKDFHVLLPIPQKERDANPVLDAQVNGNWN